MSIDESLRSAAQLSDRVAELRAWAASRIAECRRHEQKFGVGRLDVRGADMPQATIEAWTERRALLAVLAILDGTDVPR